MGQQWETDARSPVCDMTIHMPSLSPSFTPVQNWTSKRIQSCLKQTTTTERLSSLPFYTPTMQSFPPLARSPPDQVGYRTVCPSPWRHSHWLYICTPTSCNWLCGRLSTTPVHGRSSMPFSWRSSIIMFCRNEAEDLDYSTLDCLCLYPAACATSPCGFFFSRSIKHPPAIVQFVRRPMCSYEPWLHSFLNEGSKSPTSFCLPGFYTGK